MTNIVIDDAIYRLQASGGISTIWRALTPLLQDKLPEFTFDPAQPPDIFISTYYQAAPPGATSVVMVYDYIHERYPGLSSFATDALWKQSAVRAADAVVAISQWTANDVRQFQGKPSTVAYPATSLERASAQDVQAFKAKYGLPDHYVLIVGRRDLYKNVSAYWQALRLLPHTFTLCIGGEALDAIQGHRQQLRLDPGEMAAAYTGARCLVYPSLYEGFGLPVLEASSCGCPVICGSGGALAEINAAALVVDVTRPRSIAEALMKLQDPGVRIDHVLRGYEMARRFSWQQTADQMVAIIKNIAERENA
jgi:glycosyltransferase involved in cell wall biosynthesis